MSKKKNILFVVFSLFTAFLILLLFEAGLRYFQIGTNVDHLFLTTPDGRYLYMNKDISKRYFTTTQATTGNIDFFKKKKDSNVVRLFVLGESAALGFPYPNNISFQRMLKYEIQKNNPDKDIEIINLSLTAINSHTFYDFSKELIQNEPDAILIYGGHNEYYGALGVASTNGWSKNLPFIRLTTKLRRLYITQLLGEKDPPVQSSEKADNLMKKVVKDQIIPYRSPLFYKGIEQFERNMKDLLTLFEKDNIPVYLSTIATNLKDQYPLDRATSTEAASLYDLANKELEQGEKERAFLLFTEAKQKDGLRFRAPDEINGTIIELASRFENVHLVNALHSFYAESEEGIPGYKLLLEHVHPTITGHRLIARSFLLSMEETGFFKEKRLEKWVGKSFFEDFPVLEFDSLAGEYACAKLKTGFPFYESTPLPEYETLPGKLAIQYVTEKNWYKSMEQLYKSAVSLKDYSMALDVIRVRILDNKYDHSFYHTAGELCVALDDHERALDYYKKGFAQHQTPEGAHGIVSNALRCDKPEEITPYWEYLITHNKSDMDFNALRVLCAELILLKQQLRENPEVELYRDIAAIYNKIGNTEIAGQYLLQQANLQ